MFLDILNREEKDYCRQIELKYELKRKEIKRLMKLYQNQNKLNSTELPNLTKTDVGDQIEKLVLKQDEKNDVDESIRNNEVDLLCNDENNPVCRLTTDVEDESYVPNNDYSMYSMSVPVSPILPNKRHDSFEKDQSRIYFVDGLIENDI